ncbi:MAG: hypothetical protein HUK06_00490 [Bacteroidaceae bacterium]|nr:hypothetical protein [Bacteroidaceae bacterium]
MRIHIFNPEHEIALALDKARFTPSHNVVKMRRELAYIPILWATDGDYVLVEDVEYSYKAAEKFGAYIKGDVHFVGANRLRAMIKEKQSRGFFDMVAVPWGWDKAIVYQLKSLGWPETHLPSEEFLDEVRKVSHRRTALSFLKKMGSSFTSHEVNNINDIVGYIQQYGDVVLKSPWSCSGRGIRFVNQDNCTPSLLRWIENVISQQGSLMVEPRYDKLRDFALEFEAVDGGVKYCGLSVFDTCYTVYTSSLIATEDRKMEVLEQYMTREQLEDLIRQCEDYLSEVLPQGYEGGIGIDMMIVKNGEGFLVHPCVEINFRRTMGHVALCFDARPFRPDRTMELGLCRNFELKVR